MEGPQLFICYLLMVTSVAFTFGCYEQKSPNFCLSPCLQFFWVYPGQWDCWISW